MPDCFIILTFLIMKSKKQIIENWLPRYTGRSLNKFGKYILLTNFIQYVNLFAKSNKVPVIGLDKAMPNAAAKGITIVNFGMGSSVPASIGLSGVEIDAVIPAIFLSVFTLIVVSLFTEPPEKEKWLPFIKE